MADRTAALAEAKAVGGSLPDLLIDAHRVAATVLSGWHGRRTAGRGEAFWQFRPFLAGDTASAIDWRRSARDEHIYIREKEWEAVHTVWLWRDASPSMAFRSHLADVDKIDRATVLTLALAEMLAAAGERVGLLGAGRPVLERNAAERIAMQLAATPARPEVLDVRRHSDVVLFGDFLDPVEETLVFLEALAKTGAQAHLVQVTDPAEEVFPYRGRTEFLDPETGTRHVVSRAETYRADYAVELASLRDRLDGFCRRLGWTFFTHHTDRPATEPLLRLHSRLADRRTSDPGAAGRAA